MKKTSLMSRRVTVIQESGNKETYGLSIADIITDKTGIVTNVDIRPFEKEEANVAYIDSPLLIIIGMPLKY